MSHVSTPWPGGAGSAFAWMRSAKAILVQLEELRDDAPDDHDAEGYAGEAVAALKAAIDSAHKAGGGRP